MNLAKLLKAEAVTAVFVRGVKRELVTWQCDAHSLELLRRGCHVQWLRKSSKRERREMRMRAADTRRLLRILGAPLP